MWRAEESDCLTRRVLNRGVTVGQLFEYFPRRQSKQNRMGHSVVADQMPTGLYLAHNLGLLPDILSDEEERSAHIVAGEYLEQS